jgi:allophanate hydrolase subunit 2
MADAQVSGGYPKLGFVIENDLSKLAQLGVGAKMRFEMVSYEHAIDIMIKTQNSLELINKSLKLRENEDGYKL